MLKGNIEKRVMEGVRNLIKNLQEEYNTRHQELCRKFDDDVSALEDGLVDRVLGKLN